MPKLDWIGKKAVVNHHRAVPFHLLKNNDELSVGDPGSGNLLVQGDNLIKRSKPCCLITPDRSSASISILHTIQAMKTGSITTT